jgi:hypothetical protein
LLFGKEGNAMDTFQDNYDDALGKYAVIGDPTTKSAVKGLLQSIYNDLPFTEMKRSDCDHYVRPPE